jgi:hypothetical protein
MFDDQTAWKSTFKQRGKPENRKKIERFYGQALFGIVCAVRRWK